MKLKPQGPAKILREVNMKKPVLKQGWLLKCNATNTLHRVRYCVLVPGRLLCYSGVECAYVNSEFRLQDCEVELVDDLVVPDNIYTKAFGVATGRHNVLFAAPTLKDRADWVAGIKESGEYGSATDPNGAGSWCGWGGSTSTTATQRAGRSSTSCSKTSSWPSSRTSAAPSRRG